MQHCHEYYKNTLTCSRQQSVLRLWLHCTHHHRPQYPAHKHTVTLTHCFLFYYIKHIYLNNYFIQKICLNSAPWRLWFKFFVSSDFCLSKSTILCFQSAGSPVSWLALVILLANVFCFAVCRLQVFDFVLTLQPATIVAIFAHLPYNTLVNGPATVGV